MKAALAYVEETFLIAEIVRLVPRWLAPYVAFFDTRIDTKQDYTDSYEESSAPC
jgi:hypothetical protein